MRILFVSGVSIGGSIRSTGELARRLAARDIPVGVLQRVPDTGVLRYVHTRAVNLGVKLHAVTPAAKAVGAAAATIGRRPRTRPDADGIRHWDTILPENSLPAVCRSFRPDVVVAASVSRTGWRRMRTWLSEHGIASVLYIREEAALGHLGISHAPPDLLLANAHTYADQAEALGFPATMVPSVVTLDDYVVESSRTHALFINPVDTYGVDRALALATARPDIPFSFVEWWDLGDDGRAALRAELAGRPNVELRPSVSDPAKLYTDARLLLTPYTLDMRPRVVLEAQVNGIPVLATDLPALSETVGPGGVLVAPDAPIDDWIAALGTLYDDETEYQRLVHAARLHAARDEVDPDSVVTRFTDALTVAVGRRAETPPAVPR
ncbi:MAG TPA: glycosyltransferase [Acidimicrobiia bacterium]|nr:glycosyltransferase [Acidimicrobiia bacterium]